jgi:hypothetical protein
MIALALDGEDKMGQADTKGLLETRREICCTKAVEEGAEVDFFIAVCMLTTNRAGGLGAPATEEGKRGGVIEEVCPEPLPERARLEPLLEEQDLSELMPKKGFVDNGDA